MAFVVCLSVGRAVVCVFSCVARRELGAGRGVLAWSPVFAWRGREPGAL